jgi:uncharacterized protein YcbK (DUF882 family)
MNFTVDELCRSKTAQRRGIDNTPTPSIRVNLEKLIANVLQPLRDKYGKPIIVDSGYRCPKLNTAVGGAKISQHLYGQAADIRTVSDTVTDNKRLFDTAKKMIDDKEIIVGQLINEYNYNWVHISIPDERHKNQIIAIK